MFYYLIYSSSITNYKDGQKKIITTLLYATIAYVLLHAFITLSESKLIQKLRLYFWIILLIDFGSMYYTYQNDDDVSNWYKNIGDIRDKFNSIISSSNNSSTHVDNSVPSVDNNGSSVGNSVPSNEINNGNPKNDIVDEIVNDIDNENDDMVNRMLSSLAPPIDDNGVDGNGVVGNGVVGNGGVGNGVDGNDVPDFLKPISTKEEKKKDLNDFMDERERSLKEINPKKPDKKRVMSSDINDLINSKSTGIDPFEGSDIGSDIEMDFNEFEQRL